MSDYRFILATGTERDVETYYGFKVLYMTGWGMPPLREIALPFAQADGVLHQKTLADKRAIALVGMFTTPAKTTQALHSLRKKFVADVNRDATADGTITLRYYGANLSVPIDIPVRVYGATGEKISAGIENTMLQLSACDPFWHGAVKQTVSLNSSATLTGASYAAQRAAGIWDAMAASGRPAAAPTAIAVGYSGAIYFAVGSTLYRYASGAWTSWSANGTIRCLAGADSYGYGSLIPNVDVWIGGDFTTINSVAAAGHVAYYATSDSAFHTSAVPPYTTPGNVYGIANNPNAHYPILAATGVYGSGGGVWASLDGSRGSGMPTSGGGTAVAFKSGNVYTAALSDGVWKLDKDAGSSTNLTPTSAPNGAVNAIVHDGSGNIYIGGAFTTVNGVSCAHVAKYNGTSWSQVGSGLNNTVNGLAFDDSGVLWAVGAFTDSGMAYVAKLVAGAWAAADISPAAAATALAWNSTTLDIGYNSATAPTVGGTASVTNSGDHQANPVITISRAGGTTCTLVSITNVTSGAAITFNNYALADGETVTIDLSVTPATITSSLSGNILGAVTAGLDTFGISPGTAIYTVYAVVTGSPTITASVAFYYSYWSADGVAA